MQFKTIIEPFRIKSVEPFVISTEEDRIRFLHDAFYNPFLLESDQVMIDLLTDSGTSAMSSEQWAGVMRGDEAYAGSRSWKAMQAEVKDLCGMNHILPTHQGRSAERIVYQVLGGPGKVFISNTHFDTTRANIEYSGAEALDFPQEVAANDEYAMHFKGNMDTEKLRATILDRGAQHIGAVILTVTNNSGGGQPASMSNARAVSSICNEFKVPFVLDCCRIAENSYFIKHHESGYSHISYRDIAREMFSLADIAVMSAKKDALVNMGGFLALRNDKLASDCRNILIITEGFTTYGGLCGRDMEAIAIGLREVFDNDYLEYRIRSTNYLGRHLQKLGVPIISPVGGHAVYVDAAQFYPHISVHEYPGQALVCELYKMAGIRSVEIGSVMFGKYDSTGKLKPAAKELVRLALPRRVYTQSHIEYVIEAFAELIKHRQGVRGYQIIEENKFLRHFTAKFKPIDNV